MKYSGKPCIICGGNVTPLSQEGGLCAGCAEVIYDLSQVAPFADVERPTWMHILNVFLPPDKPRLVEPYTITERGHEGYRWKRA